MQIKILNPIGFCYGVSSCLKQVQMIKKQHPLQDIYLYGQIIHNQDVNTSLIQDGFHIIEKREDLTLLKPSDIVIFPAHGHFLEDELILNKLGITYFDLTCPRVQANLNLIKNAANEIIYIGKKDHLECQVALSYPHTHLCSIKDQIIPQVEEKPLVIAQTSLSYLETSKMIDKIKKHYPQAIINPPLCQEIKIRQENLLSLNTSYDLCLVLGSKNSSNTNELYQIASKQVNIKQTYLIENIKQVEELLKNQEFQKVLITSGTSCPYKFVDDVVSYLQNINFH